MENCMIEDTRDWDCDRDEPEPEPVDWWDQDNEPVFALEGSEL